METNKSRPKPHGIGHLRGIEHVPCSIHHNKGRFGRLFANLPALHLRRGVLERIAQSMREGDVPARESTTPAGFTFLGQFIDHDITLDVTTSLERQSDPTGVRNFRTPVLELDSLYRSGPETDPALYDRNHEGRLLVGTAANPDDLARNTQGTALIGDPRNDENGILSQLHLAFQRFHNGVLQLLEEGKIKGPRYYDDPFREAQRLVRWHYQWIIVHEYLPVIVDASVLESIWRDGLQIFDLRTPFMPIEFAAAGFRFGHSQVRNRYTINAERRNVDLFQPPGQGLTSFAPVPPENVVDWRYFFQFGRNKPQGSREIDTRIANELFALPFVAADGVRSLPLRNLLRGQETFALPAGEAVAMQLGVEPIPVEKIGTGLDANPLWFYILKEAELNTKDRLGAVGGRIVAETLIGLLKCDPMSYLSVAPSWKPCLPAGKNQQFEISDLLRISRVASK